MYCEVINSAHQLLSIVPLHKALKLITKGKAIVHEADPYREIRTVDSTFPFPRSVMLKEWRTPKVNIFAPAPLRSPNLFLIFGYRCAYCGRHNSEFGSHEILTIEHVIPLGQKGPNAWHNVVAACSTCNRRKGNRTPEQAQMTLLQQPRTPTRAEIKALKHMRKYR